MKRWTAAERCPVCDGWPGLPSGRGIRCAGYLSGDEKYLHCTREEHAGSLESSDATPPTFAHLAAGECRCGQAHGERPSPKAPPVVTGRMRWEIADIDGHCVAIHERRNFADGGKAYAWLHPDGRSAHAADRLKVSPDDMLYGMRSLATAAVTEPVLICEGEKAADAVLGLGVRHLVVLGTVCGAPHIPSVNALSLLTGRRVYLWPDRDDPGQRQANALAARLVDLKAADVRVISWGERPKDDAADFVSRGGTSADFVQLAKGAPQFSAELPLMVAAENGTGPGPRVTFAWSSVAVRKVEYLWRPRIPRRKVTILAGLPGVGKSYLCLALASAVTRGYGLPEQAGDGQRGCVLYCSLEDDIDDTLKPRLLAMGGDVSRVESLRETIAFDRAGLRTLDRGLAGWPADLIIFDTLSAFATGVDMNTTEMRQVFTGLRERAVAHNCSIVLITHLRKDGGTDALLRVLGSVDIAGAARSVMLAGRDPDDRAQRYLLHIKANVGREAGALGYRLTPNVDDQDVADFQWTGSSDMTQDRLLGQRSAESGPPPQVLNAADLMRTILADGAKPGGEVRKILRDNGVSMSAIGHAAKLVGMCYYGGGSDVEWRLPPNLPVGA